jgi:hypothetical protein
MPGYRRGLRPLDEAKHARFKSLAAYGYALAAPSYPIDRTGGIGTTAWGMDGNGPDPSLTVNGGNPVGDCGPCAMPAHGGLEWAAIEGEELAANTLSSDALVTLYFTYEAEQAGVSWRPPALGTAWSDADIQQASQLDDGVDLGDWLLWLVQQGLVDGFVKLSLSEMDAALGVGFAVVVGVNLNPQADQQFDQGGPWNVGPGDLPDPQEGHAILRVKVVAQGGTAGYVSWGQEIAATAAWDAACPQQAFGVITRQQAEAIGFPLAQVVADLRALGGTVAPAPAPTPTPPAPPPVTPPATTGCNVFGAVLGRR